MAPRRLRLRRCMDVDRDLRRHQNCPARLVGERTAEDAEVFIRDLASRLTNRVRLTTDGLRLSVQGGDRLPRDIDYAMLHSTATAPLACTGINVRKINGNPNPDKARTSYMERQEPYYANGYAPLHPIHLRVQHERRKPWAVRDIAALLD